MKRSSAVLSSVLPGVVVAGLLLAVVVWDPGLAGRLVREDGVVEYLQVGLAVIALGIIVASSARHPSPADVVLAALLAALAASEIDLDQRLFGIAVIDWRFFRRSTVPLPVRGLVAVVIVGTVLALLVYTAVRWRDLWNEAGAGVRDGWIPLLVAGLVLFGIPQPCERCLNRLVPLPRYFLEETLELLGVMYLALAIARRSRAGHVIRRSPSR
jgi:uncharacterized membrane protein YidH (DUF202 family)